MKLNAVALTLTLVATASTAFAQAQPAKPAFEPQVGQAGKDVIWVPTNQALVDRMLDLAKVTAKDFVIDLGSGDGRTVITAAKRGARAVGIEYNPEMVELSKRNAEKAGVSKLASFMKADLFETDFSQATVITMFLLPSINVKLRPKILDLKPGTRIVSNTFDMGEWEPDEKSGIDEKASNYSDALLWIVPAKVDGIWRSPQGDLTLKQSFQKVSGSLKNGNVEALLNETRLRGDQISFVAGGIRYGGKVIGNTIEGTATAAGKTVPWKATRGS